ncbi:NAD(P)H-dependent oxidoreductase [uncultured Cyclobacterium sp.]|uniref:NAD(P)H-dependent oxidoreductase n=1 Tax=uncultured Cyclobacterium sp. TaxID=453820 RepID=UPI0030EB972D|tara:strand:- start:47061 stop:47639 length:579 start_codon:yes stop_codon:yes gene_type:complete
MKHLIIYAHPNPQSLNGYFKNHLQAYLLKNENEIVTRDLYQINFNPVLSYEDMAEQRNGQVSEDVKFEQEQINWAECITFIHPIWWTGLPAMLKGYIDRVFSYGFAYRYDQGIQKGLLVDKQVIIINTQGKSKDEYKAIGMDKAISLTSDNGIYRYCGLTVKAHLYFENADRMTKKIAEEGQRKINALYSTK